MVALSFLSEAPLVTAVSAIHDVINSMYHRFNRTRFQEFIESKYSAAAPSPIGDLAVRIRNELEAETGSDLGMLGEDVRNRLTVGLANLSQDLAMRTFGSDPGRARLALEEFRNHKYGV